MALITSFDGISFNGTDDPYKMGMTLDSHEGWQAEPSILARTNQPGLRERLTIPPRNIPFIIQRNPGYSGTAKTPAQFRQEMLALFAPFKGERQLIALHDDGTTSIYVMVDVISLNFIGQTRNVAELVGTFQAIDPIWRKTSSSTSTTNNGDYKALPTLTLESEVTASRKVYRIQDNTGRGLTGYPYKLPVTLGNDDWVFHRGRPLAFTNSGWVLLDIPKNPLTTGAQTSIDLDIYTDTGIVNPLADDLDLGGLAEGSTNTAWSFNEWEVSSHPNGTGTSRPIKIGMTYASVSYGIESESSANVKIGIEGTDRYDRQFDAIGINAGVEISSVTLSVSATECRDARLFLKRLPVNGWWTNVTTDESAQQPFLTDDEALTEETLSISGTHSVNGATAICVGIEPTRSIEQHEEGNITSPSWEGLGYQRAKGLLTISGNITLNLNSAKIPTATLLSTDTAYVMHNQSITNETNGDTLFIKRAFMIDDMVIDTYNKRVTYAAGRGYADWTTTDQDDWFALEAGTNTVTVSADLTVTYSYEERFVV